jgi:hypothetical protein
MSSTKEFLQVKKRLRIPPEGWNSENFSRDDAVALVQAILRVEHAAAAKGIRAYSAVLNSYFNDIFAAVTKIVEDRARAAGYKDVVLEVDVEAHEALWAQAIEEVFADKDSEFDIALLANVQSVGVEVHRKTTVLLGRKLTEAGVEKIRRRMIDLAADVGAKVNATTKKRLYRTVERSLMEGNTVSETLKIVRAASEGVAKGRIPTITRTMMGLAADEGNKAAYLEGGDVTHVSVFGCQSIEPGSPTYRGIHTCNIQDVPVEDMDKLFFHPNHTGTIIPSRFRNADGSAGHFPTRGGVGADGSTG